tara:strand:+ start:531 stop:773 length:243 start_codon:yes stop_codon:yes gene_type:complete
MKVGDLVWVRFVRIIKDAATIENDNIVWQLGIIIDTEYYQAGLYKVYVSDYDIIRKYFINDLRVVQNSSQTIYEAELEDV